MVRRTTRRGKRVLVIDFTYTKPDGTEGRYRRDAAVQTTAAAQTEDAARRMGATLRGDPEILCGSNGQPLRPVDAAPPPPKEEKEPTLAETIERYLAEYAPSALCPSTVEGYRTRLKVHVIPRLGTRPLTEAFEIARSREIDVAMISAGLAASHRRGVFFALRSVARFAVEAKLLPHLPAFIEPPTVGKRVPTAPAPGDVATMIDAAPYPEWRLVILLAAHAGLRRGEILALRCVDCEIGRNRLVVRLSRFKRWQTGSPKSGHEREVPLTPQLRDALLVAGVDKRPGEEYAALNTLGKPWAYNSPYDLFQKTLRRLKLSPERLHALRAFFITTLLNGHVPVHVVRELAGHGNLATTQMYAAVVEGDRTSVVGVLEKVYQGVRATATYTTTSTGGQAAGAPDGTRASRRQRDAATRRGTKRIRELRRKVKQRRGAGNSQETTPIAAE